MSNAPDIMAAAHRAPAGLLRRLCLYYLSCIANDDEGGVSLDARQGPHPEYLELPQVEADAPRLALRSEDAKFIQADISATISKANVNDAQALINSLATKVDGCRAQWQKVAAWPGAGTCGDTVKAASLFADRNRENTDAAAETLGLEVAVALPDLDE